MKAVLFLAALAVIGSGCENGARKKEQAAIKAVLATQQGLYVSRQFPSSPKSVRCVIRGERRNIRVPGTCTTLVILAPDGSAAVLFRETWDTRVFDAAAYGMSCPHAPCPLTRRQPYGRMHTWDFTVSKDGQVPSSRNYGDLPPQYVH